MELASERENLGVLYRQLQAAQGKLEKRDRYYNGLQRLKQLGLAIPPELEHFTVIVNWPRVTADARVDRLDLKGFQLGGDDELAADMWKLWQKSGMAEDQSSYLDFEVFGRSFKVVNIDRSRELIENVSPLDIICHRDPMTGVVDAALRRVRDLEGMNPFQPVGWRYYTPEVEYVFDAQFKQVDSIPNPSGLVQVVPAYRNPRTALATYDGWPHLRGTSCLDDVMSVTDACARDLSNAQLAQETHAVPQRVIAGVSQGDFIDPETGEALSTWEAYFGRVWALTNENAKATEFSSSSMENFERMVTLYARLASGVTGLPPNYFGLSADDAASADAIRSREAKLVKSIERDQRALGDQAIGVLKVLYAMCGCNPAELANARALWFDAGTPTVAQRADAVSKLYATSDPNGRGLLPREMAWEELGWSPEKIERAKQLFDRETEEWLTTPMIKPLEGETDVRAITSETGETAGDSVTA